MMNYDANLPAEMREMLKKMVGRQLDAYMDDDGMGHNSTYDVVMLNVENELTELRFHEIVHVGEFIDETTTMRIYKRESPQNPSCAPEEDVINDHSEWVSHPVGKKITGIALAVNTRCDYDDNRNDVISSVESVQGLVVYLGDEAIVFDKELWWSRGWSIRRCRANEVAFVADSDLDDHPDTVFSVKLERL